MYPSILVGPRLVGPRFKWYGYLTCRFRRYLRGDVTAERAEVAAVHRAGEAPGILLPSLRSA